MTATMATTDRADRVPLSAADKVAIIAGSGRLPIDVAEQLAAAGHAPFIVMVEGEADFASKLATFENEPIAIEDFLHLVPMLHDTVWVDDDAFEIGYHVRHTSLPRPGSEAQLRTRCAEILERPLDRKRPLWEMWVIEGLEGGKIQLRYDALKKGKH